MLQLSLVYSRLLRQAEYETADVMNGILQDSLKYAEQKQCGHDGKRKIKHQASEKASRFLGRP